MRVAPAFLVLVTVLPYASSATTYVPMEAASPEEVAGGLVLAADALAFDAYLVESPNPPALAWTVAPVVNAAGWTGLTVAALSCLGVDERVKLEYAGLMGTLTGIAAASSLAVASASVVDTLASGSFSASCFNSTMDLPGAETAVNWMLAPAPIAAAAVAEGVLGIDASTARTTAAALELYLARDLSQGLVPWISLPGSLPIPAAVQDAIDSLTRSLTCVLLADKEYPGWNVPSPGYEDGPLGDLPDVLAPFSCAVGDVAVAALTLSSLVVPCVFELLGEVVIVGIEVLGGALTMWPLPPILVPV